MSLLTAIQFSLLYFLDILDLVYIVIRSMNTNMGIVPPNLKYSKCLEYISTRKGKKRNISYESYNKFTLSNVIRRGHILYLCPSSTFPHCLTIIVILLFDQ